MMDLEAEASERPGGGIWLHHFYCDPDADVVLQSSDGVRFRVHSIILKLASDVFAGMVTLPRPAIKGPEEVVLLAEGSDVIAALLDTIYPRRPLPMLEYYDFIGRLADAADKYDIPDVTSHIRTSLCDNQIPPTSALDIYGLACRQGWVKEASFVSQFTLSLDLFAPACQAQLVKLDSASMLGLFELRKRRRDLLVDAMSISYDVRAQSRERRLRWEFLTVDHVGGCRSNAHDRTAWAALKFHVLSELESSPQGERLRLPSSVHSTSFWNDAKISGVWNDTCSKCGTDFFSKDGMCVEFSRILGGLPTTIE